jgi:hypothetical protein
MRGSSAAGPGCREVPQVPPCRRAAVPGRAAIDFAKRLEAGV